MLVLGKMLDRQQISRGRQQLLLHRLVVECCRANAATGMPLLALLLAVGAPVSACSDVRSKPCSFQSSVSVTTTAAMHTNPWICPTRQNIAGL
jgi:hypothetical protein